MDKKNKKTDEDFLAEKKSKSLFKKIFDIVFWVVIIVLFAVWLTDFIQVKNENKPVFCLKTVEHSYDDGTTSECIGLGYKVYTYNRDSLKIKSQFSPFFVKMEE